MDKRPIFPYVLEMHLVDHCNLNCKGCSHFSSLVKGQALIDIDDLTQDLQRFRELFSDVYEIRLMGGEPLLHPDICKFIENTRHIFQKTSIAIYTNGILLKEMPNIFWEACRVNHAYIKLTKYPIQLDIKAIKQIAKANHVRIKIPKQVNIFYKFINIKGDSDPEKSFRSCRAVHICPFLRNGKLFTCAFAPHVHLFNQFFDQSIPVTEGDYVDIYGDVTPEEILDFLMHPVPLCQWCNVQRVPFDWGKSNQDIQEWINGKTNTATHFWYITKRSAINIYHRTKHYLEIRTRKLK